MTLCRRCFLIVGQNAQRWALRAHERRITNGSSERSIKVVKNHSAPYHVTLQPKITTNLDMCQS
jgi:hypothetical protein